MEKAARQSGSPSTDKRAANVHKTGTIPFQVGLIISLLLCILLFEIKTPTMAHASETVPLKDEAFVVVQDVSYRLEMTKTEKAEPKAKKRKPTTTFKTVPDDTEIKAKDLVPETTGPPAAVDPSTVVEANDDIPDEMDFRVVESVPIYPGCEGFANNDERRDCMQGKISKLVSRNFDNGIAGDLGLSGVQRIYIQFKIDKVGQVTEIRARAPHPKLEEEATRVISKLPDMTPGKQRNVPVGVRYSMPIIYKVQ